MSHAIPPRKSVGFDPVNVLVSNRISHMAPSASSHDVVDCINRPLNACSLRQPGTMAPTPRSDSTASFTDEMSGTMDRRRDRTNPPDRLLSPCTRHSQDQAFIDPDSRLLPSVLHRPIMSLRSEVPPAQVQHSLAAPDTGTSYPLVLS